MTAAPDAKGDERREQGGPLFWVSAIAGAAIVVIAARNLIHVTRSGSRSSVITFVLGAGVAHDALWAPLVVLAGALTLALPLWARLPVRLGLCASALTVLVSWPEVRRYGARVGNPSVLPLDYARNLVAVLVVVWVAVAVALVVRARRTRASA